MAFVHRFDDAVLGVEAGEERRTDQCQRTDQRSDPGDRHVLSQPTHPAYVLVVVHADDHRTGGQEQQCLEEGVRHQVEHCHRIGRGTQRHRHIAQLRQRGIGDHALDVVLDDAQKAHEQRRDGTNHQHKAQSCVAQLKQRRHACHHENACRHHGGGVDQCGDRRRAFHGIGQPDVQRKLRALAHGANEQANAGHAQHHPVGSREIQLGQVVGLGKHFGVVQRAAVSRQQANAQDKAKVADTVHQKGLHVGENRGGLVEPEADQQVGHQPHAFPAKEQLQHVVAHHEHQHRKGEQRDVREEAVIASVFFHVAYGVDVHHQRHKGHNAHHHRGQAIDQEANFHLQRANLHPGVNGLIQMGAVLNHAH